MDKINFPIICSSHLQSTIQFFLFLKFLNKEVFLWHRILNAWTTVSGDDEPWLHKVNKHVQTTAHNFLLPSFLGQTNCKIYHFLTFSTSAIL